MLRLIKLVCSGLLMSRRRICSSICTDGGLVGGPTNCSCDEDLLLFRLSTNSVGKRVATLQLSSGFGSHHHFMDLVTHSLLGHSISGLFPAKLWATHCCLSIVPAWSIARFASRVGLRLCQGLVVPICGSQVSCGTLICQGPALLVCGPDQLVAYCAPMEVVTAYISCCKKCGPYMQWILADGNGLLPCQS
jgi:hypothetical protein